MGKELKEKNVNTAEKEHPYILAHHFNYSSYVWKIYVGNTWHVYIIFHSYLLFSSSLANVVPHLRNLTHLSLQ